ncbi:MAG: GreA/GreB family elongation factor [Oscillospiraceae bacterium]|nr:GreA/GreB family elongation factor [bacterium]MDY5100385.1 GreA/GreB family elongation factor [Oscillospiraceae bacterium]
MHDELTAVDIRKMQEEIDYRENVLMPQIIREVQRARGFGDLSENYEYKAAKDEQRRNRSRIRYLKQMVASAVVIEDHSQSGEIGLFDRVKLHMEDEDEDMDIRLVTTLRQNPLKGLISKESPLGQALLGHRAGERVYVKISGEEGYWCSILSVEKGEDDENLEISRY